MGLILGQRENTGPPPPALFLTVLLSVVTWGCSDRNPLGGLKLYPVKGKVMLSDGKPLTSGRVVFVATKSSITSTASIESDGAFTFKGASADGLPEGEYKVRFEAASPAAGVKGARVKLIATPPFDMKYLDEDSSEVTATVAPDESKNNFTFNLKTYNAAAQARGGTDDRRAGR